LSDSDKASVIGDQGYWILSEETFKPLLEPTYPSGTPQTQRLDTVTGFFALSVQKDAKAIDETEGILSAFASKLAEQNIEPAELVKKVWKTSE